MGVDIDCLFITWQISRWQTIWQISLAIVFCLRSATYCHVSITCLYREVLSPKNICSKYVQLPVHAVNIWLKWIWLSLQLVKNVKMVLTFDHFICLNDLVFTGVWQNSLGLREIFAQNAFRSHKIYMNKFKAL